ncbi:glutaredoxin domain-containing protein [Rhodococcoides fascians]|uniref:glutaredoxin domain-containing protein n=1 Tax=Rhodococcoides fascians TaxID=1828 RepID=UPI00050CAB47|nr:glutaredoxin domain-containing protein [Rhodococcus fascians]
MNVTLYSQKNCMPCTGTKRALKRNSIEFTEVDVASAPDAADPILELGYRSTPVVIVEFDEGGRDHWDGYRPDKIEALAYLAAEGRGA